MPTESVQSTYETYGFPVRCTFHPDAEPAVRGFFGPVASPAAGLPGPALDLTVTVSDPPVTTVVDPPHNLEAMMADPVVIDTGGSRAVLWPADGRATLTLARQDVANQIVWGRFLLERLFLYLVGRSRLHYPLHAGAIEADGVSAMLVADGGVGKSTFTAWALHRGATLVGEDIMVRHLQDPEPALWGYPRAVYLSAPIRARIPALASAWASRIGDADKYRIVVPEALSGRLRPATAPHALMFLARAPAGTDPRPVPVDEAIQRCRADFSVGKTGPALAEVEADLRSLLAGKPIWEFPVTDDLDESYRRLREALRPNRPAS